MGSVPPELSLNFRPSFVPETITSLLKEVSLIGSVSDKVSKLDDFVKRLEEEKRKINAFKRELPLCMLLLNDAVVALKEELVKCMSRNVEPVLEQFIPLNNNKENKQSEEEAALNTTKKEKDSTNNNNNNNDKKNWMSSVQLWNTDDDNYRSVDRKLDTKKRNGGSSSQNRGGATTFMPFKAKLGFVAMKEEKEEIPVPGLTLLTPGINNLKEESCSTVSRITCSGAVSSSAPNAHSNFRSVLSHHHHQQKQQQQQNARKQRRCWSPELHRRFVNALQQLGGSQAATPKQIRERMQVDGLTNDEVKSHLQKYRLHTRRVPASTTSPANQSIVLGSGLWMSQDQYGDSSKGSSSQSGSPQGPLQLATNTEANSTPGGDSMEDDEYE